MNAQGVRHTLAIAAVCAATTALAGCAVPITGHPTPNSADAYSAARSAVLGPEGTVTVPQYENPTKKEDLWEPCELPWNVPALVDSRLDLVVTEGV